MVYQQYINSVPKITLKNPLSEFLGMFDNGIVAFSYFDVVKNAKQCD